MIITPGTTDVTIEILVVDDDGKPVTGLVAATMPDIYYSRVGETLPSALTLSDLAAQNSAHSDGGAKELAVGRYRLDLPDAACATATLLYIFGEETGKRVIHIPIAVSDVTADAVKVAGSTTAATRAKEFWSSIESGTAQAGGSTTITLESGESSADDFYNGSVILLTGGTGASQYRQITDYNGTTKVATVDSAWGTNPDSSTTYQIMGRIV